MESLRTAHLAKLGIVRVERQASLQDRSAALQMVAYATLLHALFELRPGHPGLDKVRAHLHAFLEGLPRSHVLLWEAARQT